MEKPAGSLPKDPAQALEQLMDNYGTVVMRTAFFYTGDHHLAEDISQEAFLRAYRKWASFRGDSSVKTWLTKITINLCRDKMGKQMFFEQPTDPGLMELGRTVSVEDEAMKRLRKSEVLKQLLRLPLPYQEVLYLYYYLDLNTREIAEIVTSPEGTVRTRLFRAREALAQMLKNEEEMGDDR